MDLVSFRSFLLGIQYGFETFGQIFRWAFGPKVREVIRRLLTDHVIVQSDNVDIRFAQCL